MKLTIRQLKKLIREAFEPPKKSYFSKVTPKEIEDARAKSREDAGLIDVDPVTGAPIVPTGISQANLNKLKALEASSNPASRAQARSLYANLEYDEEPQVPRPGESDYDAVMGDFYRDQDIGRAVAALDNVGPWVEYFYKNDASIDADLKDAMKSVVAKFKGQFEKITPKDVADEILYQSYPSIALKRATYLEDAFEDLDIKGMRWLEHQDSAMKGLEERLDDMKDINNAIADLKAEFNAEKEERIAMANSLNTVSTLQGFSKMFPGIDITKGSELLEKFLDGISYRIPGEMQVARLDIYNIKRYYWNNYDDFEKKFGEELGWIEEKDWTEDTWGLTSKFYSDFHAMVYALIVHAEEAATDKWGDPGDYGDIKDHVRSIVDMYSKIYKNIGDGLKSDEPVDVKEARKDFIEEFTYPIAGHIPDKFEQILAVYNF